MPRNTFPKFDEPTLLPAHPLGAKTPTAISLFSGIGSFSKGLRELGYTVLSHDFMPESAASLNANGFDVVQGDIRAIDFSHEIYADTQTVVGGPPCQPYSQAGRNGGEDDTRDMIPEFQRAVALTLPRFFIMENVRGLAGPRHRGYLNRRVSEFEAMGYHVEWRVLNSADHGVAQDRKRLFVIGVRLDFLTPAAYQRNPGGEIRPILWPRRQPKITMAEALDWSYKTCEERNAKAPKPGGDFTWPLDRPSTTVVGSFAPEVQAAPGWRAAGDGPRQNAPGSVVTTQAERLVLQGFPKDWEVKGCKSKVDLQIGNSCPTTLTKALIALNMR